MFILINNMLHIERVTGGILPIYRLFTSICAHNGGCICSLFDIIVMVPCSDTFESVICFFRSFTVSPSIDPHAFEYSAIFKDLSQETMRLAIFKLAFFDATVVPASATDAIFLIGFLINLTVIIIWTDPFILYVESLCYKMIISDMGHAYMRQCFPCLDGRCRNLLRNLAKG